MVDFLLVGPLTNFAMCINMYGSEFLDKVRNIWIMGGNYRGKNLNTNNRCYKDLSLIKRSAIFRQRQHNQKCRI